VIHLVPNSRFEDGQHVGRQATAQAVGAEGTERDGGESGQRSEESERPIHSPIIRNKAMPSTSYPAASAVAPKVQAHLSRLISDARERGVRCADLPEVATIEAIVTAAFWASLRREEGYVPRISLALVEPDQLDHPLIFQRPLPLEAAALTKVAPAVERRGIHLGVRPGAGGLEVWGTTRVIQPFSMVIEVEAPGLLVIKHPRGEETSKFVNIAVLEGDEVKIIDEGASRLPDCPALLNSLLGFESPASWRDSFNLLVQIAVSMRAHGRGGTMLVVPAGTNTWHESIVQPMSYSVSPPFLELSQLSAAVPDDSQRRRWEEALARAIDAVAGLTAVDGAAILTTSYDLLAFGAKIGRRRGRSVVDRVTLTEPIEGASPSLVEPAHLGGTRHLSAAQFVHDQQGAVALVASQDGRFTVFAWSACEDMVHAHRVETLLL
jgi:hypothetical protein